MRILVTGGAGFIGSHLVDALCDAGHQVTILDNMVTGNINNVNSAAALIRGDIVDKECLDQIFEAEKFELVYHLAAQINLRSSIKNPSHDAHVNIIGSLLLIQKCVEFMCPIIFSSTGGAIYSITEDLPFTEQSLANPSSPYGLSKQTVEKYLELMHNLYGLSYTCLRYSNVYGPRQNAHGEAGVISIFMDRLSENKDINIFGDGLQTRDFIYVKDVVAANLLAPKYFGTYNISTNTETSILNIANKLLPLSKTSKINFMPAIKGEMTNCKLDFAKFSMETGWKPKYSFDIGIDELIAERSHK